MYDNILATRATQQRHHHLSRMLKRPRIVRRQETNQNDAQDTIGSDAQNPDTSITEETSLLNLIMSQSPSPTSTSADTRSSSSQIDSDSDAAISSSPLSRVSTIGQDTQISQVVSYMDPDTDTTTMSTFRTAIYNALAETTSIDYSSSEAFEYVATTSPVSSFTTPTSTMVDQTPVTLEELQDLPTFTSTTTEITTSESLIFLPSTSVSFVTPTTIHSHPPATSYSHPSTTMQSAPSFSPLASLVPVTPDHSPEPSHEPAPVGKLLIIGMIFLAFMLLTLSMCILANWKRLVNWFHGNKEPQEEDWDFSTKYGTWKELKDDTPTHAPKLPSEAQKDLRSRFSDATNPSVYSSVTSARSSTMSDYCIDPSYAGPELLNSVMPPALNEVGVVGRRAPNVAGPAVPHAAQAAVIQYPTAVPRPMAHAPPVPPRPKESPLLPPEEFFSLPSSSSLQSEIVKHERTGSAPVFGNVVTGAGELRERREAGISRASRAMSRALAKDGISGIGARASGFDGSPIGSRRSNSVSVLMDMYLSTEARWL